MTRIFTRDCHMHHHWLWPARFRMLTAILLILLMMALLAQPRPASAHPLGNFTTNLYSRLEIGATQIHIFYVLDMAEIPTYQELAALDSGPLSTEQQARYLEQKAAQLRQGLQLLVDGHRLEPSIAEQALSFPPGQGGLATLRLELQLIAQLPALTARTQRVIDYHDTNYGDRIGWHEIVIRAGQGASLVQSDAPSQDLSNALRTYPQDMLTSPPDVRSARAVVQLGGATATAGKIAPADAWEASHITGRQGDYVTALISTQQLTPTLFLLTLLAALGLGALHALSPGHGKTIVGAYLVGARGTARHAVILGLAVTVTHTAGVFALGLITLYASHYILPEQLYPWLGTLSGALVVALGFGLLRQRLRSIGSLGHQKHTQHDAGHSHHDHGTVHHHHHDNHAHHHTHDAGGHSHLPPGADGSPVTWRSLLALGISGGLVPCPSALVVMLSAISLGRIALGLLLIVAFSLGLASVLIGIGIAFVYSGRWLQRAGKQRSVRWLAPGMRLLPIASALVVTVAGLAITIQALAGILD